MASIEHRSGPLGDVWRVRFRYQRRNIARGFSTEKGALAFKAMAEASPAQALAALDAPEESAPLTVVELLRLHIDSRTGITDGTRSTYRGYVSRDFAPDPLGSMLARDVTRDDVAAFISRLERRGMRGKTIAHRRGLLSGAFNRTAIPNGIAESNPTRDIKVAEDIQEKMFLTQAEFAQLLTATPVHYRPLVLTLVSTGVRISEALALQVRDLDVEARSLRVERAWKYTDGAGHVLGPPKSRKSVRTVAVPSQCVVALEPLAQGRGRREFLFTTPQGLVLRRGIFRRDAWVPAVSVFPEGSRPRVHDLRHTHASWAIQAGVPLPVLQRQLGHENIETTVSTYGHLARADFDALAGAIGERLPVLPAIGP